MARDRARAVAEHQVGSIRGQRTGAIARRREPAHQLALSLLREGVEGHLLARVVKRGVEVPKRSASSRKLAEHTEQPMAVALAGLVHPVVVQVSEQVPRQRAAAVEPAA